MVPNLDLILVAFLYGSLIACVILLAVFVILITLLLTFSFSIFSIVFIDSYIIFSLLSNEYVGSVEANLELGFVLLLYFLMRYAIAAALASKPSVDRLVSQLRLKAQHAMNRIDALLLVHIRRS